METPRKFITAVINLRGVSTNKTIIYLIAMQTYKELISIYIINTYIPLMDRVNSMVMSEMHPGGGAETHSSKSIRKSQLVWTRKTRLNRSLLF